MSSSEVEEQARRYGCLARVYVYGERGVERVRCYILPAFVFSSTKQLDDFYIRLPFMGLKFLRARGKVSVVTVDKF